MFFLSVIENSIIRNNLESIFKLYSKELIFTSYSIINDYHESEDVVQSALIKISDYLDESTDVKCDKTRGLLVIIVRRLSYNIYNQRKRRNEINIDDIENFIGDDNSMSPELNILRLEDRKYIADMMRKLNESYMDILTLKYMYDYSDSEIADMLNMTEGNVRTKLSRARKACHKIIGGDTIG